MLLTPNQAQQLVAVALHRLPVAGLHVEAEEGFGVGGAEVEPPVAEVHGKAVEVVYLCVVRFAKWSSTFWRVASWSSTSELISPERT